MTPEQAATQRLTALRHANVVRSDLASMKRTLNAKTFPEACEWVADLLDDPERLAGLEGKVKTYQVLDAIRGLGDSKMIRVLKKAGVVNPSRRLCELTDRQQSVMGWQLLDWAERYRAKQ